MRAAHASLLVRHGFAEGTVLAEANAIRRRAKSEAKEQAASGERSRAEEARECDVCHHRHHSELGRPALAFSGAGLLVISL